MKSVRSRFALKNVRAGWLMATAGILAGTLPSGYAIDDSFHAPSTLAPQVAPKSNDLDATIASMVSRGKLPDLRPAHSSSQTQTPAAASKPTTSATVAQPTPEPSFPTLPTASTPVLTLPSAAAPTTPAPTLQPQRVAANAPAETASGQWRPAGSSSLKNQKAAEEAFSEPQFPSLPTTPEPAVAAPSEGPSFSLAPAAAAPAPQLAAPTASTPTLPTTPAEPKTAPAEQGGARLHAPIKFSGPTVAPSPGADDDAAEDDLAPIDELSETPAPDTDAPGDPQEPEMTGAAVADPSAGSARPLSEAPKTSSTAGNIALGEPDRYSRPSDRVENPTDAKDYEDSDEPTTPAQQQRALPPLTKNQIMLRNKVRQVLKYYYSRPLNAAERSPWEVMHGMLAFEVHSRVLQGTGKQPITAVGWLCFNQPCENRTLMYLNEDGDLRAKVGPALQGHHGQLLAILAQARVRSDYPLKVEGKDFTVQDLIEVEKLTCYPKTELTFKLIGLQRYLDINDTWVNDQGMQWDFPKLIAEEMAQPVRTAACGGTHRLAGLALAVKKRKASGQPIDGQYAAAQKFVANYQNYCYRLQNSDGSFSTDWFKGPGADPDIDRRLKTTGHQLELLMYAGSDEQLHNYRTVRAVNYLTNIMHANRTRDWEAGPLGHAVHALVLYDRLAFGPYDAAPQPTPVAQKPGTAQR
ncbi:hypothetical protein [Lacipirellula parvula]|nr:hypothetical protein [Lacipirellula parvula]